MNEKNIILIVDDSASGRNVLNAILKQEGYHIEFASTGREALKKSLEIKPDLVLLSIMLPDMDGFIVCSEIRNNPYTSLMPIIIVTALDDRASKIKGLHAGADEFLSKPLDPLEVKARVGTVLKLDRFRRLLYDRITGLPNEILFVDYIDNIIIGRGTLKANKLAVMTIRLSNAVFLDNYLSKVQDQQLVRALAVILEGKRKGVMLISYNREGYFSVLLNGAGREIATRSAQDIVKGFGKPIKYQEGEVLLSCKIGISLYPEDGLSGNELINNARLAFDEKQSDQFLIKFYDEGTKDSHKNNVEIAANLFNAVEKKEFILYFQPQLEASSGKIIGMEALIRWDSSKYGFVFPDFFIQRAEENGTIIHLGNWVIKDALRYLSELMEKKVEIPQLSINVSPLQFADPNLDSRIMNYTKQYGLNPERLKIEITEGAIISNLEESRKKMMTLKEKGFKISIDDFGTGQSSLAYIKEYPVDEIKIDKVFIRNIETQKVDYAIVKHIIELAHTLNLGVVAEGVENENQLNILKSLGCDIIQGYFFSKPVSEAQMTKLMLTQPFLNKS